MVTIVWDVVHADGTIEVFTPWRDPRGMFVIVPMGIVDPNLPEMQIAFESEDKLAARAQSGRYYILMASDRSAPILIAPGGYVVIQDSPGDGLAVTLNSGS